MNKPTTIKIYAKCDDRFCAYLNDGRSIESNYPPDFLGGGDAVELEIELATGKIIDWKVPDEEDLKKFK